MLNTTITKSHENIEQFAKGLRIKTKMVTKLT